MASIHFNDALRLAALSLQDDALPVKPKARVIRDVYGRLRFALDCPLADYPAAALEKLQKAQAALGPYATNSEVLSHDSFSDPQAVFGSSDWHRTLVNLGVNEDGKPLGAVEIQLLDRQITGQDWLRTSRFDEDGHPPRVVFYGLKGGVGRSTALAMLAYRLARDGQRVLLIDFDLESPGLSGLLLPQDRVATYGLVDWFVEDAVGQGDEVLRDMVSLSPLADQTPGSIHIAAAMGQGETAYLSKLARVYADTPSPKGPQTFADRMLRITRLLEAQERPDIVLIDSRAGLHDVAAVAIGSLASVALLFATDAQQNWQGYRQLFNHWHQRPEVLRQVRERIVMVQALFPESDQAERASRFVQNAWDVFRDLIYDELEPDADTLEDAFSFDLHNEDGPHFPMRVRWNARFQEFDPMLGRSAGGVDDTDIDLAFGPFIQEVIDALPGLTNE
ncbi:AAA family ATPase [uncultured Zoogloea sp.]|uniref:KGGVGR-motif variant AAA ATPase n=1 Tax=uncultured Zoogloea sp. TaxID=160237 RepID=UPI002623B1C4|nr:AAA family ATPase [uncultured Zoogloea sp.]